MKVGYSVALGIMGQALADALVGPLSWQTIALSGAIVAALTALGVFPTRHS